MEKNIDPLALLREARQVFHDKQYDAGWHDEYDRLAARIDAALAERQDSAEDVVESKPVEWSRVERWSATYVGDLFCQVQRGVDFWSWDISQTGLAPTETEAKAAAIATARGMR